MIQPDQTTYFLADAYREASLAGANMRIAAEAIETMRAAMLSGNDIFDAWNILDQQVNLASESPVLKQVLIALREHWETMIFDDECERLQQIFYSDSAIGWKAWLNSYAGALSQFRLDFASELCKISLPFPDNKGLPVSKIQLLTDRSRHARWAEALPLYSLLGEEEILIPEIRTRLLSIASDITALYLYKFDDSRTLLDKAEKLNPKDWHLLYSRGNYYFWQAGSGDQQPGDNNQDKAKSWYQRLIKEYPDVSLGYTGLAELLEKENDLSGAVENSLIACKCLVSPSDGYASLLRIYGQKSLFDQHRDEIPKLVDNNSAVSLNELDQYQAYLSAGYTFQLNNEPEEAHRWYRKAVSFDDTRLQAYTSEAYLYLDNQDYPNAITNFRKTIEVAPESIEGYWGMAQLTEEKEAWEEAIHWYEESLKQLPEWESFIHIRIGNIKQKQNKTDEAIQEFLRGLEADSSSNDAINALNGIALDLYKKQGEREDALKLYQKIHEIIGVDYEKSFRNLAGNLYYYFSEYQQAAVEYRKAIKADPGEARFYSKLALALEKFQTPGQIQEELDEAISHVQNAVKLQPDAADFTEQLLRLEQYHAIILKYGEQILTYELYNKKIRVKVETSAMETLLDAGKANLTPEILKKIAAMRLRIQEKSGIEIPGIDFAWLDSPAAYAGDYQIDIMGQQVAYGQVHPDLNFAFCQPDQLKKFESDGIASYLIPQEEKLAAGFWLGDSGQIKAKSMGIELIESDSYLLSHIETMLVQNLDKFCDHQQVSNLLEQSDAKECSDIICDPGKLNRVTWLLKDTLRKTGSITDFDPVCKKVNKEVAFESEAAPKPVPAETEPKPGISSILLRLSSSSTLDRKILEEELSKFQPYIFNESGLVIPSINTEQNKAIDQNDFQLQFDDQKLTITKGLAPDEILVFVPYSEIKEQFPDSYELIDPTNLNSASVLKDTEEARTVIADKNYEKRNPLAFINYCIAGELRLRFDRLLNVEQVKYFIVRLKQDYPVLVNIISFFFTDEALTFHLKEVLKKNNSIKNLPVVLENLLEQLNRTNVPEQPAERESA